MRYIIITGGELLNKGAQAMTFITVDEMKKRFPDHRVVLLSIPKAESYSDKEKYSFEIETAPDLKEGMSVSFPFLNLVFRKDKKRLERIKNIYKHADLLVDISGYALASNWSKKRCLYFIRSIRLAKKYNVPVYILPQSFGPFDYKGKAKLVDLASRHYLRYPKLIMAREEEGKKLLETRYKLKNVIKTEDMVLLNTGINAGNIYCKTPEQSDIVVEKGSVAIIPNVRNNKYGDSSKMTACYEKIINWLLSKNRKVYMISHSAEDVELCRNLCNIVNNPGLSFIDRELSCLEFDRLVTEFDYIVGSRYHAIVHAYRNCVPALVMGWAVKYAELTKALGQEKYQFDVRNGLDSDKLVEVLGQLDKTYADETEVIKNKLDGLRNENLFDRIQIKMSR